MATPATNPIRRILIPLDGSTFAEQALPYARAIGGTGAELVLVRVVPYEESLYGFTPDRISARAEVRQAYDRAARAELETVLKERLADYPNARFDIAAGDYAQGILDAASRNQSELIVMATHGRGGLGRWIIGSVADRVARSSPVPVLLVHPRDEEPSPATARPIERIVVPLDGSELAAQALPATMSMALDLGIPVLLVSVVDLPVQISAAAGYGTAFSQQFYEDLLSAGIDEARQTLDNAALQLSEMGVTTETRLLEGPVSQAIAGAVGEHDLVVMTSHGRGGIKRFFLGSVANQLVNEGQIAVMLVPATEITNAG